MNVCITFCTDNAAFEDPTEVPRILKELADNIDPRAGECGSIRDSNGNKVGSWEVSED